MTEHLPPTEVLQIEEEEASVWKARITIYCGVACLGLTGCAALLHMAGWW